MSAEIIQFVPRIGPIKALMEDTKFDLVRLLQNMEEQRAVAIFAEPCHTPNIKALSKETEK